MAIFDSRGNPISSDGAVPGMKKLAHTIKAPTTGRQATKALEKQATNIGQNFGADVRLSSPEIRNPLLNLVNFYLPYDRRTLNQWIRYYDKFQPVIGNCIDLHGEFPMSDFNFTNIDDSKVTQFYDDWKEDIDLVQWTFEISREYELIGETFTFWPWDEDTGVWDEYVVLNPDLLEIKTVNWGYGKSTVFTYDPPQELKELVKDQDPRVHQLLTDLDDVVYENLLAGKRIPIDGWNMIALMRRSSPYEARGTSPILRVLKELLYEDKIREAQYAIADQQITPVQLWKLGDPASGYMPTDQDLADFRDLLLSGAHDPLFTIVSHGAVSLDLIGYTGKLLPVIPEFEWVEQRIMIGLFTNKAMITGEGPTYSNAVVAMKALQGRYQSKRDKIAKLIKKRLLTEIAKSQKFIKRSQAELSHRVRTSKRLMVPDIEWTFKLDLTDETQKIQYLMQLREKTNLPLKTISEILDFDYETAKSALKSEEGTVFDPVYQAARAAKAEETPDAALGGAGAPLPAGGEGIGGEGEEAGLEEAGLEEVGGGEEAA